MERLSERLTIAVSDLRTANYNDDQIATFVLDEVRDANASAHGNSRPVTWRALNDFLRRHGLTPLGLDSDAPV